MRLYCTVTNDKGKTEGMGANKWIEITLSVGNQQIGRIILDFQGGKDWDLSYERQDDPSYLINSSEGKGECAECGLKTCFQFCECKDLKTHLKAHKADKGKTQTGKYCNECMSTPCKQQ